MANVTIFWFRRDLRLDDNVGLYHALKERTSVLPLFIFDTDILAKLEDPADARVTFIYQTVSELKVQLQKVGGDLWVEYGTAEEVFKKLSHAYNIEAIYTNHDYEPESRRRDKKISQWASTQKIEFLTFKDQTLFEKDEILAGTGKPYTVYTPYKKKVLATLSEAHLKPYNAGKYLKSLLPASSARLPSLKMLGFSESRIPFPSATLSIETVKTYDQTRNFPALDAGTTHLGLHLRFGTVSIRELAKIGLRHNETWLSELIWRDFFMQILWHYPQVEKESFRPAYDKIAWRKSKADFIKWSEGQTGYPLVDAGMRELNATGYMHNRVRMVTASFLCKHLLIYWYEGERYFAKKLLDYDLAANNGNWQWAAGSGCDAAPYFRIFNPLTQAEKFDPDEEYIKKWVPEYGTDKYVKPMIDHVEARGRCLAEYHKVLRK